MIKINNLQKIYRTAEQEVIALEKIDLKIETGEIFGIIGPSGAGKSTLIRCLNLLEEPTSGDVIIAGQDLTELTSEELREARKELGMIFQNFNLLKSRTVAQNVAFPLELAGEKKSKIKDKVDELLKLVGLADKADSYPSQLSGGQQQRVGIARALANDPQVLLCDEATSSLDPETTQSILELLKDINQKLEITIVLITHEMEVIKEICTKVAVLEGGQIVEEGAVIDIFLNPQQEVTKRFVQGVINADLPEEFLNPVDNATRNDSLVKVSYIGQSAKQSLISDLIHQYQIKVNILYGNIDKIQGISFGTLVIGIEGNGLQVKEAIKELLNLAEVEVEVLRDAESVRNIS
ncbi:methionine ABC transporter ATP-binding protein [Natroniella sulfidigena]|uniref:methionine ABC transporter ATP-binding protein n=1 Tax=Natroniella sulfidigena TaxID=723921 RepID=UPI00200AB90A|nr:methionine ABC transporter ATP-binding protein [Natroniella sulfidigena]MCK8816080.1 methionine ABC transporter ATP-binding protein [Natroniella sulfidigena]